MVEPAQGAAEAQSHRALVDLDTDDGFKHAPKRGFGRGESGSTLQQTAFCRGSVVPGMTQGLQPFGNHVTFRGTRPHHLTTQGEEENFLRA